MPALRQLFISDNALVSLCVLFLRSLNVKVSRSSVNEQLENHPDFPSLFALSECLRQWNVENAAVKIDPSSIAELPTPFVTTTTKDANGSFVIVHEIEASQITVEDHAGLKSKYDLGRFCENWDGVALLAEPNDDSGELNYRENIKRDLSHSMRRWVIASALASTILLIVVHWAFSWQIILLLLVNALGIAVAAVLVSLQFDTKKTANMAFCKISTNADCERVLSSPASKIFGISMAEIGLVYFCINFGVMLTTGGDISSPTVLVLALCNFCGIPYTLFSLFYQWRVVRAWCPLCIVILGLVLLQALIFVSWQSSIAGNLGGKHFSAIVIVCLSVVSAWLFIRALLKANLAAKTINQRYYKIIHNERILSAYLQNGKKMPGTESLTPIVYGKQNAKHIITIVTNPYCRPCGDLHIKYENLINVYDSCQIHSLLYICNEKNEQRVGTVKHMLALRNEDGDAAKALSDWFKNQEMDSSVWKARYPVSRFDNDAQLNALCDWCRSAEIKQTPTVFVDGYQYPDGFEIEDVMKFLQHSQIED